MIVFLDTETTALNPGEIAQLSYIIAGETLEPLKARNHFFTVRWVSRGAQKVHGLSKKRLKEISDGCRFEDRGPEIRSDLQNTRLVGHNVSFDIRFLRAEFSRLDMSFRVRDTFCTMKYHTPLREDPGRPGRNKYPCLEELLEHLGISEGDVVQLAENLFGDGAGTGYHDSRFDAAAVFRVYEKTMKRDHASREGQQVF